MKKSLISALLAFILICLLCTCAFGEGTAEYSDELYSFADELRARAFAVTVRGEVWT